MSRTVLLFILILTVLFLVNLADSMEETDATTIPYLIQSNIQEQGNDLRSKFLKRKRNKIKDNEKLVLLEDKKSFYYDDIPHYEIKTNYKLRKTVYKMEKAFREMIAMYKVKYIYNRGDKWRTWREVKYTNGEKRIVFYNCHNLVNLTCPKCHNTGFWLLDDRPPPCPFEIYSVKNKNLMCGANITQLKEIEHPCPVTISFDDLTQSCNNPIETEYRITRVYSVTNKVSERNPDDICGGRESCKILTFYEVKPDLVVFRIINKTSHEIKYSRIMKNDRSLYVCIEECGIRDPITKKVYKNEKPLVLNLLEAHKRKRENFGLSKVEHYFTKQTLVGALASRLNGGKSQNQNPFTLSKFFGERSSIDAKNTTRQNITEQGFTKAPCCKNVTHKYNEYESISLENEDSDYEMNLVP